MQQTGVGQRIYIGQFYDENTNLNYFNARYYNASQGQFISTDPSYLAVGDPSKLKQVTGIDQQGTSNNARFRVISALDERAVAALVSGCVPDRERL